MMIKHYFGIIKLKCLKEKKNKEFFFFTAMSCCEKAISCVGIFGVKLSDLFPPKRYKRIHGELAQMIERPLRMRDVPGSIPGFSKFRVLYSNQYISAGTSR